MKLKVKAANQRDRLIIDPQESISLLINKNCISGVRPTWKGFFRLNDENTASDVYIPEEVEVVENGVFAEWEHLKHIRFMNRPHIFGAGAFANCPELETVVLAEGTDRVSMQLFLNCRKLHSVCLPESVNRINLDGFRNCSALRKINFPKHLTTIEMGAFYGCSSLKELTLPDGITEIGDEAFTGCTGVTYLHLPAHLESLGEYAFMNCTSLETVVIPASVKVIPEGAFAGCKNLKRVVLHRDIEHIDPYAFYGCDQVFLSGSCEVKKPKVPMELLYHIAGEIPGRMLAAMGFPWADTDARYKIHNMHEVDLIEVHEYRDETEEWNPECHDCFFLNDMLEQVDLSVVEANQKKKKTFRQILEEDEELPF